MKKYDPKAIEPKWQQIWADTKLYAAVTGDKTREKYYMLTEFPYPSGAGLHAGHTREYTLGDVMARHKRMQGYNVLFPMGYDAFGLPTENYAIQHKIAPQVATAENIATFRGQFDAMGFSFDWDREVNTTDPDFYRWTQWLFLKFLEHGLAYQAEMAINWCPKEKTGLANEEVVDGKHERCGTPVEKKLIKQWMLKITAYADRLIEGLKTVDYPPRIADQQVNWIGRSEGAEINWALAEADHSAANYLLLHGFTGHADSDFQPWLSESLGQSGARVTAPELPNTEHPDAKKQAEFALKSHHLDEHSIVVGHSYGAVTALRIVEQLREPIRRLVLVAGFAQPGFLDNGRVFESTTDWEFDFERIRNNVREIIILRDTTDTAVPAARADYLREKLGGQIIDFAAKAPHVTSAIEPVVLQYARPSLTVYTTRPDTLFGATFLVVSPEVADSWRKAGWKPEKPVDDYITRSLRESELSRQEEANVKTGEDTGIQAIHPLSGDLVPVWVADYVLGGYGTGAIMAVPAHDERDGAFAKAFNLPIKVVIKHPDEYKGVDASKQKQLIKELFALSVERKFELVLVGGAAKTIQDKKPGWLHSDIDVFADRKGYDLIREYFMAQGYALKEAGSEYGWSNTYSLDGKNWLDVFLLEKDGPDYFDKVSGERFNWHDDLESHDFGGTVVKTPSRKTLDGIYQNMARTVTSNYTGYGKLINSGEFDGLEGDAAKQAIVKALEARGSGKTAVKYKLRDWIFSRQHYWGEPIPVIHCPKDGVVPVPDDQLPVKLPEVKHYEPTDTGESPLATIADWVNTTCPKCGGPAKRETDTMPNWAGSSWYYLRYMDAHNNQEFASKAAMDYWGMADIYLGGMEHTTLHLLYSRFWHQFFYDQGLVPTPEPYAARRGQGIVLASDGRKMSKSIGNVVNPTDIIATHGADTLRLYILFMAPYDETTPWSEERLNGASRFVYRVWALATALLGDRNQFLPSQEMTIPVGEFQLMVDRATHKTIKKVHDDLHDMHFNTAVSALMEYVNFLSNSKHLANFALSENTDLARRTLATLVKLMAPIMPHIAEEIWMDKKEGLGQDTSVHVSGWPEYDPELIKDDVVTVVVQVNGKVRANLAMAASATDDELKTAAQADPNVAKYLSGTIVKTIVVPRKLVNFVVK